MNNQRTSYPPDFKRCIMKLYMTGFTIDLLHKLYAVHKSTLASWRKLIPYIEISDDEKYLLQNYKVLYEKLQSTFENNG